MDWRLFASVFALIFLAELPGKTSFSSLLMAARGSPWPVFFGANLAFAVHSLIAVAAGSLLSQLPARLVQATAGLLFLILSILLWREKMEDPGGSDGVRARFAKAFSVTFAVQWGDPSQLATAALAAKYAAPLTVLVSATLALWIVTSLAVAVGHWSRKAVHPRALQKVAVAIFAGLGLYLLARALRAA